MNDVSDRFWSKVSKNSGVFGHDGKYPTECWEWIASTQSKGRYGVFFFHGKNQASHRVSWELNHKKNAGKQHVLHKCDNGLCIRPSHLFLGSHIDNMRDRNQKGRARGGVLIGKHNSNTKLSVNDVQLIRTQYKDGISQAELSRQFNVSDMTIHKVVKYKTWKHL